MNFGLMIFRSMLSLAFFLIVSAATEALAVEYEVKQRTYTTVQKPLLATSFPTLQKGLGFSNVTIRGYTIPVCGEEGVALENRTEGGTILVAGADLYISMDNYQGKLRSPEILCYAMEVNATSSLVDDVGIAFYWQDYLDEFEGTWVVAEGTPHYGPYAMYRFTHPDGYIQYVAVYPHLDDAIMLSVGAMPRYEETIRDILVLMMAQSGLGRPGIG